MEHRFAEAGRRKRVAIMVSREDHCLADLLWRWRNGELEAEVTAVVSNHPDHAETVGLLGVGHHHIPVAEETKAEAEARALELLAGRIDLLILARYMQVLSPVSSSGSPPRRSTSITASCPPSSAPTRTSAPMSAASSWSAPRLTT